MAAIVTPCVFPLISITLTSFVKQAEGSRANTIAANPWVNLTEFVLFVVFALVVLRGDPDTVAGKLGRELLSSRSSWRVSIATGFRGRIGREKIRIRSEGVREEAMKIEILTISGCPNALGTLRLVADVLAAEGLEAQVTTVEIKEVAEAKARGFLGSPTVQVDGADIETARREERNPSLSCRVYPAATGLAGTPPREMIRAAFRSAR